MASSGFYNQAFAEFCQTCEDVEEEAKGEMNLVGKLSSSWKRLLKFGDWRPNKMLFIDSGRKHSHTSVSMKGKFYPVCPVDTAMHGYSSALRKMV